MRPKCKVRGGGSSVAPVSDLFGHDVDHNSIGIIMRYCVTQCAKWEEVRVDEGKCVKVEPVEGAPEGSTQGWVFDVDHIVIGLIMRQDARVSRWEEVRMI